MPARAGERMGLPDAAHRAPWSTIVLGWRDRLLASSAFQRWAARFPLTRPIARRQSRALFDLCAGFVYAQVLSACLQLRLFEILAEGPQDASALASRLGLGREAADALIAAAVSLRLLERRGHGRYGLGVPGAALLGNPGVAALVAHHAMLYADLADPVAFLRGEGRAGTSLSGYWPYAGSRAPLGEPDVAPYTRLMSASQPLVADQILDAHPLGRHRLLLDIGGGDGTFLTAAARRAPNLRLRLFDLPAVAGMARGRLAREGLCGRAEAIGGSFLEDDLPAGNDVVSLVRVIHDHDDEAVLAILRRARAALVPGGTLLLAEPMSGSGGTDPVTAYFSIYLFAMGSGRPRSATALRGLLQRAGFVAMRDVRTSNPLLTGLITAKNPR